MNRVENLSGASQSPISRAEPSFVGQLVRNLRNGEWRWSTLTFVALIVGAFVMALPFLWLLSSSLKLERMIFIFPPQWIPNPIRFQNYVDALTYKPFGTYITNTLWIVLLNEIAIVGSASLCAYGFARIRFPGRDVWFGIVLATMMVPYFVLMIPQFVIFSRLGR